MKKLLFITHHYLDGTGGGCYASRAFINAFAELYDLTLLYPIREGKEALAINGNVHSIPVAYDKSRWGKLADLLLGRVHRYYHFIKRVDLKAFDVVVFDTSMVSFRLIALAKSYGCQTICIHHNYQYEYFKDNSRFPLSLPILFWCKRYEGNAVRQCDLNLTLSPQDKMLLMKEYGGNKPFGVLGCFEYESKEEPVLTKQHRTTKRFVITGGLSSIQTEVSLMDWLQQYWPLLLREYPDAQLTIAGKSPSSQLIKKCTELGIRIIPSPKDINQIIQEADYYICPTHLGGGLKLRIMDGLSAGLPVLTHEISARGYDAFRDKCLFAYSDADSFVKALKATCDCSYAPQEIVKMYRASFSFEAGVDRLRELLKIQKKRLLIFHPTIAPYRIDFFNSLYEGFDTQVCLYYRNLHSQKFDYAKIESQFAFTPQYLEEKVKLMRRTIYGGIWEKLKAFSPDIVLVNEYCLCTIAVLAYKWLFHKSFKVVTICDDNHNMVVEHNDFSRLHRTARKLITPFLDDLILPDCTVTQWYQDHYHKGCYFPIIRDDQQARATYERLLPQSRQLIEQHSLKGKYVFLFVGRLVENKNVDTLIKAFSLIKNDHCLLVIVGDGEKKPQLESLAENHHVLFTGRLEGDDLYAWYNVADSFVLPSHKEPFGAVTNEALLAGCWCLISEKAGSQCLIKEGVNGDRFNPDHTEDLRDKMKKALNRKTVHDLQQLRDNLMCNSYQTCMEQLITTLNNL